MGSEPHLCICGTSDIYGTVSPLCSQVPANTRWLQKHGVRTTPMYTCVCLCTYTRTHTHTHTHTHTQTHRHTDTHTHTHTHTQGPHHHVFSAISLSYMLADIRVSHSKNSNWPFEGPPVTRQKKNLQSQYPSTFCEIKSLY
jgi:hypothetical protein